MWSEKLALSWVAVTGTDRLDETATNSGLAVFIRQGSARGRRKEISEGPLLMILRRLNGAQLSMPWTRLREV